MQALAAYGGSVLLSSLPSAVQNVDSVRVPINNLLWLLNPNVATNVFNDLAGTTAATNGQNIGNIKDLSTWGMDGTAHLAANNGPVLVTGAVNGRSVMRFNGTSQVLKSGDHFGAPTGDVCYVFAYKPTSSSAFQVLLNTNDPSGTVETATVFQNGANVIRVDASNRTGTSVLNNWQIICVRVATAEVWQNGTQLTGSQSSLKPAFRTGSNTNQYSLGAKLSSGSGVNFFAGDVGWFSIHDCGGSAFSVSTMLDYARSLGSAFGVSVA